MVSAVKGARKRLAAAGTDRRPLIQAALPCGHILIEGNIRDQFGVGVHRGILAKPSQLCRASDEITPLGIPCRFGHGDAVPHRLEG